MEELLKEILDKIKEIDRKLDKIEMREAETFEIKELIPSVNLPKYTFETWKEVQEKEVNYWFEKLFTELRNVANADVHIGTWKEIKNQVKENTDNANVREEFDFNEEKWLEEIYVQIEPYFIQWLVKLSMDDEWDYSEYVNSFWDKPCEEK